jgi:hypothetical protein
MAQKMVLPVTRRLGGELARNYEEKDWRLFVLDPP